MLRKYIEFRLRAARVQEVERFLRVEAERPGNGDLRRYLNALADYIGGK